MNNNNYTFYYDFNAVGQGLFATGNVRSCANDATLFNWVYDCGSSDSPAALDREIDAYIRSLDGRDRIDFFIISHLDRDHINGVAQILKRVRINKLFLPYVPLVERIEIALSRAVVSPDALRYAADPVGYLAELGGDNLGEVVFVVGEDGEGPIPPDNNEPPPPDIENISNLLRLKEIEPPEDAGGSISVSSENRTRVTYTSARAPVSISGLWEFVFFNETFDAVDASLTTEVEDLSMTLCNLMAILMMPNS